MLKYNVQVYFPLSSYLDDNEKLCLGLKVLTCSLLFLSEPPTFEEESRKKKKKTNKTRKRSQFKFEKK